MINYNSKKFRPVSNTANAETSEDSIFEYQQKDDVISCIYSGGSILTGLLLGKVASKGNIQMCYQQMNVQNKLTSGACNSRPEILKNGKIRLYETWEWLTGDKSKGESILEEI